MYFPWPTRCQKAVVASLVHHRHLLSRQRPSPLLSAAIVLVSAAAIIATLPMPRHHLSPIAHHDPLRCQCLLSATLTLSHLLMLATSCPPLLLPLAHCRYPILSAIAASCPQLSSLTQLLSTAATTHVLTHPPPAPANLPLELRHCHLSSADVALSLRC